MATMFSSCETDETNMIMWGKLRFSAYVNASYIDMFRLFPKSNPVDSNVNGYDFRFYLQTEDGHFFTMFAMCEGEGMGKEIRWTLHAETDEIANKAKAEIEEGLKQNKSYSRDEVIQFAEQYAKMVSEKNVLHNSIYNQKWIEENL